MPRERDPLVYLTWRHVEVDIVGQLIGQLRREVDDAEFCSGLELRPGQDWRAALAGAVADATVVLLLLGPDRHEPGRGWRDDSADLPLPDRQAVVDGHSTVIPILIGGAQLPSPLPERMRLLAEVHPLIVPSAHALLDQDSESHRHLVRPVQLHLGRDPDAARGTSVLDRVRRWARSRRPGGTP